MAKIAKSGNDYHGEISDHDKNLALEAFNKIATSLTEYSSDIRHNIIVGLAGWYLLTEKDRYPNDAPDFKSFMGQVYHTINNQADYK